MPKLMRTIKKTVPGLNVQWPWSRLILDGVKTIETRSYDLSRAYLGRELAIIETAGPRGKREAGITEARIIGTAVISETFEYKTEEQWTADFDKHGVGSTDRDYSWKKKKVVWGWKITRVRKFHRPRAAPKKKGIIYAKSCEI